MQARRLISCAVVCWLLSLAAVNAAEWGLKEGTPDLKSAGLTPLSIIAIRSLCRDESHV